jgi:holo-[acyl-carrier protein] synthase
MVIVGVGVELVYVPDFAVRLAEPGSDLTEAFTAAERAAARDRASDPAGHLAARWAAKRAVIKAWSASLWGQPPVPGDRVNREIEVITDAWRRPRIRLSGETGRSLAGHVADLSLSHDGDYALAQVVLSRAGGE